MTELQVRSTFFSCSVKGWYVLRVAWIKILMDLFLFLFFCLLQHLELSDMIQARYPEWVSSPTFPANFLGWDSAGWEPTPCCTYSNRDWWRWPNATLDQGRAATSSLLQAVAIRVWMSLKVEICLPVLGWILGCQQPEHWVIQGDAHHKYVVFSYCWQVLWRNYIRDPSVHAGIWFGKSLGGGYSSCQAIWRLLPDQVAVLTKLYR